jgi:hypothetical protein
MTAKKIRQTSRQEFIFEIPLDEVMALLPATALESLADFECDLYIDRSDRQRGTDTDQKEDVVRVSFSKNREFEPDATGKMVEKPNEPRDICARKSEVEKMIAAALVPKPAEPGA